MTAQASLTLGPVLFNWPPSQWRDFYYRIADEAPVDTVYIGEVVCAKRAPFFEKMYDDVAARLESAGKRVVFSTLAEVMNKHERSTTQGVSALTDWLVEANDTSALHYMDGRDFAVGPYVNVYNEDSMNFLAGSGARHFTLPCELSGRRLSELARHAKQLGVTLETQVYGRMPLALSARCYHARAHGRTKDSCQYVCEQDPDGMKLDTLQDAPFLAVNGIQTLSYACLNLLHEIPAMRNMGISCFRLSPHNHDMVAVAGLFRAALDEAITMEEATHRLQEIGLGVPFCNGFYHGTEGHRWIDRQAG